MYVLHVSVSGYGTHGVADVLSVVSRISWKQRTNVYKYLN